MEKQLTITLKGEGRHADSMEFNMSDEEIRDFFGDVTALLALDEEMKYRTFYVALASCVETIEMLKEERDE